MLFVLENFHSKIEKTTIIEKHPNKMKSYQTKHVAEDEYQTYQHHFYPNENYSFKGLDMLSIQIRCS